MPPRVPAPPSVALTRTALVHEERVRPPHRHRAEPISRAQVPAPSLTSLGEKPQPTGLKAHDVVRLNLSKKINVDST